MQRSIFLRNTGQTPIKGNLWTYFNLRGTQRFTYHKPLWYDIGLPVNATDTVIAARVPNENILQVKHVSNQLDNLTACEATCDYSTFIGDSSPLSIFPQAVQCGRMLDQGARERLNRFTTSSIAANRFAFELQPNESATLIQSLLYVEDEAIIEKLQQHITYNDSSYVGLENAFRQASLDLIKVTSQPHPTPNHQLPITHPPFAISLPTEPTISAYINSIWTSVDELYEKCRAHGATLADGIEVGTRDRAQDMFPKMKSFFGAVLAVGLLGEPVTPGLLVAGALMALGVWLHLSERHEHPHRHEAMEHEHEHEHDVHHNHHPLGDAQPVRHTHRHQRAPMAHTHEHFPDEHHRHSH